jgi:hypothetical protein
MKTSVLIALINELAKDPEWVASLEREIAALDAEFADRSRRMEMRHEDLNRDYTI